MSRSRESHPALSQFTNFYVKPEDAAKLTPDEIEIMRKYTEIQDQAKKYAKAKREQIAVAPGPAGIGVKQWSYQIGELIAAGNEQRASCDSWEVVMSEEWAWTDQCTSDNRKDAVLHKSDV